MSVNLFGAAITFVAAGWAFYSNPKGSKARRWLVALNSMICLLNVAIAAGALR